jgi:hypothetical protein
MRFNQYTLIGQASVPFAPVRPALGGNWKLYLFYCDETNLNPNQSEFFVYGGIAIPADKARDLHDKMEEIRNNANFGKNDIFKFNPCPDCVDYPLFVNAKEATMRVASECGCILIVSIILHKIGKDTGKARRNEINRVVYHFHCLLNRLKTHGLVLIDRFSDKQIDEHLRNKFSVGITGLPYSTEMRLKNIIGFHYSAIGQSHFPSIIDIVLGSLRFAVNVHSKRQSEKINTAKLILKLIEPLFYRDPLNKKIDQISLNFSPNVIKVAEYQKKYEDLKGFFAECGIDALQTITNVRMY